MAMGMGSNKKRSNVGIVVVWCLVLGLALLVAKAASKDISYCQDLCRGRPYFQYIHCLDVCMLSSGHGAAARLAGNRRTVGEEGRIGGVGLGGRAGLLAIPAERPGREVEEKTKQEDAGHLTEPHGDAAYCSAFCNGRSDFGPCYNECLYGRVTGQEEARRGGGVGGREALLAMPKERTGREGEEKGKQEDAVIRLTDPAWCYDACREHPELDYTQCVKDCYAENMPDAAQLGGTGGGSTQHEVEETRGGAVNVLTAVGIHKCDWFRDCSVTPCVWHCGKRVQEGDDEETRKGALNVLAAARREVAVGACSSTVYVQSCYACCQREVTRNPDFDWYACIRSCDDKDALPIKKERENKKDGVVPPAK